MTGPTVEVDVQWMFPDGAGGARIGKRTVCLPGALPGERVQARIPKGKGVVIGEVTGHLTRSEDRQTPPCPVHDTCGGCDLAHATPASRLRHLTGGLARLFQLDDLPVTPSPRRDARARVKLSVEGSQCGYRAARSHTLVPVDGCGIARPEVQRAIACLSACDLTGATAVEVRSDGERAIFAVEGRLSRSTIDTLEHVAVAGRRVSGDPTLWIRVTPDGHPHPTQVRASPRSFYQVNLDVNRAMVAWLSAEIATRGCRSVTDFYAGAGNFSLPLAAAGLDVRAVEIVPDAIADMKAAAQLQGLDVTAVVQDADHADPSATFSDALVLDPPRRGCAALISRIAAIRPPVVALISCNPRAAARDVRPLRDAGYTIASARAFDLFPDTHHLELGTVWTRA